MVSENSNICKILKNVHNERLTIISLKNEVEQLRLKYGKFKKETDNFRSTFQKLIEDLKYKCNQMIYYSCLRFIASKRYVISFIIVNINYCF